MSRPRRRGAAALAAIALIGAAFAAGCGSSARSSSSGAHPGTASAGARSTAAAPAASPHVPPPAVADLAAAESPRVSQFPSARGRTLQALAGIVASSAQFGAATGTFTPGANRLAFAITTSAGGFIYAPTAVYIARKPGAPAAGPYLAPADPLTVAPRFRSRQDTGPGGIQAIYATNLRLPRTGTYVVLAITRTPHGLIGSPGEVAVAAASRIPRVGQRPPSIATDTPASVHGSVALLTTRVPPDDMHAVSFSQVLGKRPVALLFSTPQLCVSRVCGPVTDILVQLEQQFRNRIVFIHEEVYVDNQPSKGLRAQMKAFGLETEPWLFTVNRRGVIAARLEGSFGVREARRALEAALR